VSDSAPSPARSITTYIEAKDRNRPGLMAEAFVPDATLEMSVRTDAISFPPLTQGLAPITRVLVTDFGERYENVRTFCLGPPPAASAVSYSCDWLVAMSGRQDGAVRVGRGRYDWTFEEGSPHRVRRLRIDIEAMQALPPSELGRVMGWLSSPPYPWCAAADLLPRAPSIAALGPILQRLEA
jgi:hypothetical protein